MSFDDAGRTKGGDPGDDSRQPRDGDETLSEGALLQEIQDLADVGHWRLDLRANELTASRKWYEIWGLDPDEADPDRDRLMEMIHPEDREAVVEARETDPTSRERTSVTFRIRRPDGGEAWIASRLVPETEDGEVVALRGVNQDVTERKRAELELEEERDRLEEAQRVAGVGSWEWDLESDTLSWSVEQYRIMGYDPGQFDEIAFDDLMDRIHPEDRERVREQAEEAVETGEVPTVEYRVQLPDGTVRWCRGTGEAVVEDGEVVRLRGTNLDITDEKRDALELHRERRRLEEAQHAVHLGFVEATPGPEPDRWSDELYDLLGVEPGDVEPSLEGYLECVHPEDRERVAEAGQAALEGKDKGEISYRIVRPDGETRHVWTRFRQGEPGPGDERVVYVTVQDVTERAELEEEVRRERCRLQEAQRVAQVGSWEWDVEADELHWTDELYRHLGWEPGEPPEPSREDFIQAIHPDDRDRVDALVGQALEEREFPTLEFRVRQPDGSVRWFESRGEVLVEDGEIVRMRGTRQDITERKRLLDRLEEVQRVAGLGFVEACPGPEPDDWSDEVYRILGREPGSIEASLGSFLECVHPEDRDEVAEAGQAALDGREQSGPISYRVRRPDGEVRHVDSRYRLFEGETGEERVVYVTILDVTERARLEEELRESKRRLEEAQKIGSMGHWRSDHETGEVTGSRQFLEMWGFDPDREEPIPRDRILERVHPDDVHVLEEVTETAVEDREPAAGEFRARRPDGSTIRIETRVLSVVEGGEAVATRGIARDVTEERARERRYGSVVETTSDAVILADESGEIVGWNPAAETIFGWSQEEVLGEPLTTIMPEGYRERHREGFRRFMETGESEIMGGTVEFEGQRADGTVFPIELSLDAYEAGDTTHFCGIVRDITERKEVQQALEEEHRRLEEAQRVAKVGSWVWDLEAGTVDWSRENYRVMGLDPEEVEEITIETVADCVHPDDRHVIEERTQKAVETGEVPTVEFRVQDPDGSVRWCQARGETVVEDGEVVKILGTNQDITELKRLEQALEEERDRLEEAQRVAGLGSWEWDVREDSMRFTDEKYRLLGLDPDDPRELDLEALLACVHPEDRGLVEENRERAVVEGEYPTIEWRTNPDRGEVRWIREQGEVVEEDGETVLVRGTAMDVTQEKGRMEELEEARDAAVEANRAKSQFLANTSHEIRTPMNAIMGLTDLTLETDLTEAQRDNLETVEASADHLLSIINDLLDLSQLETGRFDLDEVPFDLREVVEESFSLIDTTSDQEGLNLAYRYGDDVPEGVVGDPQRVRQILVNLLSNAVKFTGEGEVLLRVSVAGEGAPDADEMPLLFEVEDTGKGIPEEALETLFDPYSQAEEGLTTTAEGTGLGLSIARNLVESMGGTMRVDSVEGRGSTFTFTLPAEPSDLIRERPWMGPVEDFAGSRFLVVDDNETNREIIEETVTAWGVDVTLTSSAHEALDLLESDKEFDLVLVDYYMPEMNGVEFADRIREDPETAEIPMILHTSMQRSQQEAQGADPAFADVLVKPVSPSDLFEATTRVLRGEDPSEGPEEPGDAGLGEELDIEVLLAEDNPVNRKVVSRILEDRGFEVDRAVDGEEVLEMLREKDYDLVFMDLQMPRLNGLEATEALRAEFPEDRQPYIVALTAHAASSDREKCMEAGMDGYLSKPVSPEDLERALRDAAAAMDAAGAGIDAPDGDG